MIHVAFGAQRFQSGNKLDLIWWQIDVIYSFDIVEITLWLNIFDQILGSKEVRFWWWLYHVKRVAYVTYTYWGDLLTNKDNVVLCRSWFNEDE